jgi:hypothetical protein
MPLTISATPVFPFKPRISKPAECKDSSYAISEINALISVRDNLLSDAEKTKTTDELDRVAMANEVVQDCLKPARSPYEAQCLPESDAVRERKRCQAVRDRIAELRTQASR